MDEAEASKERDSAPIEEEEKATDEVEEKPDNDDDAEVDTTTNDETTDVNASEKAAEEEPADDTANNGADKSWDNTDRKVVVHNMFRFLDNKKGNKLAQQWAKTASTADLTIAIHKVRKPPSDTFMVVTLTEPSMVQPYVDYINNNNVVNKRGGKLFAKPAADDTTNGGEDNRKRKGRDNDDDDDEYDDDGTRSTKKGIKRQQREQMLEQTRRPITEDEIREKITPLFRMSAAEQVKHKQREMVQKCAMKMVKEIKSRFHTLSKERRAKEGGRLQPYVWLNARRCIDVDPIITVPSPLRNKVEFTFGYRYIFPDQPTPTTTAPDNNASAETAPNDSKSAPPTGEGGSVAAEESTTQDIPNSAPETMEVSDVKAEQGETSEQKTAEQADDKNEGTPVDVEMSNNNTDDSKGETKLERVAASLADEKKRATTTDVDMSSSAPDNNANTEVEVEKVPSLGFMATGWSGGVSKPHCCANIPSEMCSLVDAIEDFLKDCPLPPYDSKDHQGFWRYLTVRTSRRTQQCMLIICHAPVTGGVGDAAIDYTKDWESEKERLVTLIQTLQLPVRSETGEDLGTLPVTSLFFQEFSGLSNPPPEHPVQHAFGKTVLEEKLGKCTFQISPGAFFQVNTEGAEMLYQIVMDKLSESLGKPEEGETKKKVILFDVCCGTGTIGLACLKEGVVDQVIGIDISEPAIEDAKRNAELNGFGNSGEPKEGEEKQDAKTRFVASRAEYVMSKEIGRVLSQHKDATFVAVVDPAREGLHTNVVKALRQTEKIQRIVYVSCNPTGSLLQDAGLLCTAPTKKYSGRAFRPTSACPVDMFPLTNHCELVMTFDRVQDSDIK